MSWKALSDKDRGYLEDVYKTLKSGRDTLWYAIRKKYPDFKASQRTVLNKFLNYKPEHGTFEQPPKRTSVAPIQVLQHGSWQAYLLSMNNDAGYVAILTVVETFSCYGFARPLCNKEEGTVAMAMKSILEEAQTKGIKFTVCQTDQGGEFKRVFESVLSRFGVKHVLSPPHQPTANSIVERRNGVIRRQLYALMEAAGGHRWVANLPVVVKNINEAPNVTTKTPPANLMNGSDSTRLKAQESIQTTIARRYKTKVVGQPLFIGQKVRLKRIRGQHEKPGRLGFFDPKIWTVKARINSGFANILPSYILEDKNGIQRTGRVPKTNLLPVPPILSSDEFQREASREPSREPSREASVVPNGNELVQGAVNAEPQTDSNISAAPRRSLRVRNQQTANEGEYEVDFLVRRRTYRRRKQYKVRWLGYGPDSDEWRDADELEELAPQLVADYDRLHPE